MFPMHQLVMTSVGFYLPMASIGFSLAYSFSQKKRIHSQKIAKPVVNNRITIPSFVDDDCLTDFSEGEIVSGEVKVDSDYDALLRFWEDRGTPTQNKKAKPLRLLAEDTEETEGRGTSLLQRWNLDN